MLSRLAASVDTVTASVRGYEYADYAQAVYDLLWRDFCDWYLEAIKPTVRENPAQRAVLRAALDTILRLLHPVAPFITEAVFERLRELPAPVVPGLTLGAHHSGLLCLTPWPAADASLRDERAERDFERLRGLITAVREARAQQNVPPKRRVTLHLSSRDLAAAVAAAGGLVETLAGLERATTDPPPPGALSSVVTFEAAEQRLSNLSDAADTGSERSRLSKKVDDLEKSIAALEGRLNNPGYSQRAPPHLVQQTRDQLNSQIAERDAARAALQGLLS